MSSSKTHKKPNKVEKFEIKEEKSELHSMSHYVDDRVELIKQVFTTLKWKTIRNLAPESLKKSGIAEIEELCLNELLGLSTKRLLSIINGTKCPTDTESSSESDVEKIEEHISLEEISSDSETERNRKASRSKITKKTRKKEHGNKSNPKGVSVLELLELQARARAIRSQLALEPVAKIEVDSNDSQDEAHGHASSSKRPNEEQSTSGKRPIEAVKTVKAAVNGEDEKKPKRIKLKRNFRKQNQSTTRDEADKSDATKSDKKQESDKNEAETKDASKEVKSDKEASPDKDAEKKRSPSPDVITILPSPETFFISDSSDEEISTSKPSQSEPAKVNESAEKRSGSENLTEAIVNTPRQVSATEPAETVANARKEPEVPDEPEDGEIFDFDETMKSDDVQPEEEVSNETQPVAPMESSSREDEAENSNFSTGKDETKSLNSSVREIANSHDESGSDSASSKASSPKNPVKENSDSEPDQIQNDDTISLLGHEDLGGEEPTSRPELTPSAKETTAAGTESQSKPDENLDEDIITLDNSSDEESSLNKFGNTDQNESWNCRWLKSNRVSKILATSRLGNRLRDKIKKSKKQSEQAVEEEAPPEPAIEEKFQSQYEDGSIKQYEEILERERSNPN